ncbi:hypothetical protein L596_015244 [Steinernema carpocapsae]|uniref:Uncharacterized protein n=1 Tax=Steinernema carpocapsae TaxID=34508 RepID=A0A4U5NF97_STECR|nr:hypothetical protein L596_015244 [Steinernema carpocapsae]
MWHYFRKVVKDIIGDDLEDDLERIVCSLRRVKRSGKRETVAELEKETPQDGDEYVFFYRPTTALRPETGDTVIVYTKAMEKKKNSGPQMNHADDEPRDEATGPNQNSTSKPSEEFETGRSATSALHLKYGSAQPSESGEFSLLEFAETVRHLFPVVAKLISATIDSRERLLAKLRQIAVFDFSERILGSFLLNGSSHVVRQTVTLEKMTLASVEGEFYLPKNICNASVCRCSYHFYRDRPCPQLFHFNHCKVCQRARRYHFYIKNCSGIPLESVKIEAIVMGTKVDSLWKMHKELQEIFARFANFLAEESSDLKEEKWSNLEEIEADVKKVFSYRSMQNEFSKCFQSLQEINY